MRVVSWNVQWCRGRDGVVDPRRTAAVLRDLAADVMCLQEVAVNHPGLAGMTAADDQVALFCGLFPGHETAFCAASDLPDGRGGRRLFGNLLISRYPLGQVFRHALPFPADPALPGMARSALEAVVGSPWGPLRVLTTHLEYYSLRQRRAQLAALRRIYLEGWAQACAPMAAVDTDPPFAVLPRGVGALLCGDFNCPPQAEEMAELLSRSGALADEAAPGAASPAPSLCEAWALAHGGEPPLPTAGLVPSPVFPQPVCLDRVYISENLAPRLRAVGVDISVTASDHQPLILDFEDTP